MPMAREVHDIPPAPRRVRWRAVLGCRWPLLAAGFLMTVYGGLLALMLFWAQLGKPHDDALLDREGTRGEALVHGVRDCPTTIDGAPAAWFDYRFTSADGTEEQGQVIGRAGQFAKGSTATVEFLAARPALNRLLGTRLSLLGNLFVPVLGVVVLPGMLVLVLWLAGVLRLRRVLATGDVAEAAITSVDPVKRVCPLMLRIGYRFRDHHAQWRTGQHWVRVRSPLGQRLTARPRRSVVVHDRRSPGRSRLVVPQDFGRGRTAHTGSETAPRA